jgi:hypothetical protein
MNDLDEKNFELERKHNDLSKKTENLVKDHVSSVKSLEDKLIELKNNLDTNIKESLEKKTDT